MLKRMVRRNSLTFTTIQTFKSGSNHFLNLLTFIGIYVIEYYIDSRLGLGGDIPGCGGDKNPCGTFQGLLHQHRDTLVLNIVLIEGLTYNNPSDCGLLTRNQNISLRTTGVNQPTTIDCRLQDRWITVEPTDPNLHLSLFVKDITFAAGYPQVPTAAGGIRGLKPSDGGLILTRNFVDVTLIGCRFMRGRANSGSAIYSASTYSGSDSSKNPHLTITSCEFQHNIAVRYGAVYSQNYILNIQDTTFSDNVAEAGGGVYWLGNRNFTLTGSTFHHNHARSAVLGGAGVYATSAGTVFLDRITFFNNTADGYGAFFADFGPRVIGTRLNFLANIAAGGGGGLATGSQGTLRLTASSFTDNIGTRGGAIKVGTRARVFLDDLDLTNNRAAFGGAIFVENANLIIEATRFIKNEGYQGGSIFGISNGDVSVHSSSFVSNHALQDGAGIFCKQSFFKLESLEFSENTVGSVGSSKNGDVFCDIVGSNDFCVLEGDQIWNGHCKLIYDKLKSLFPPWLIGLFVGLGVFLLIIIVVVTACMIRIKIIHSRENRGGDGYTAMGSELEDNDLGIAADEIGDEDVIPSSNAPADENEHLWGVITRPNEMKSDFKAIHEDAAAKADERGSDDEIQAETVSQPHDIL